MTQSVMNLDDTDPVERFDAALDELEHHLGRIFADDGEDAASGHASAMVALQEEIKFLTEERDQLLADLEAERSRVRRLKAASEEVSGRLEVVMGTLKDLVPAMPG